MDWFDLIIVGLVLLILYQCFYSREHLAMPLTARAPTALRVRDEAMYRDRGTTGISRTNMSKPWYRWANRLVGSDRDDIDSNTPSNLVFGDLHRINDTMSQMSQMSAMSQMSTISTISTHTIPTTRDPELATHIQQTKQYLRDVALNGQNECWRDIDRSKSDYTRDQINQYRDKHIRFRDKIMGTSAPAVDQVDRLAQMSLENQTTHVDPSTTIGQHVGQTIADFHDQIVTGAIANSPDNPDSPDSPDGA